jgi:hypothetical protein
MKFRLRRIGVLKAAIMGGIGYALMSLVFVPFFLLFAFLVPHDTSMGPGEWMFGPIFALMMPLIYGVIGFIGSGLAAAIYNLLAMMVGGLEVDLDPVDAAPAAATPANPAY